MGPNLLLVISTTHTPAHFALHEEFHYMKTTSRVRYGEHRRLVIRLARILIVQITLLNFI